MVLTMSDSPRNADGCRSWSGCCRACLFGLALFWGTAGHVAAQDAVPAPPPGNPGAGTASRPLWTEVAITVVMIGLGLFAVVRNSNRQ